MKNNEIDNQQVYLKTKSIKESNDYKPMPGYEEYYYISKYGDIYSIRTGKYLKFKKSHNGYHSAQLNVNGKAKEIRINRAVAEAWIPNPNNYEFVNHIDFNIENNYYKNLEWCTHKQNMKHSWDSGRFILRQIPNTLYIFEHKFTNERFEIAGLSNALYRLGVNADKLSTIDRYANTDKYIKGGALKDFKVSTVKLDGPQRLTAYHGVGSSEPK